MLESLIEPSKLIRQQIDGLDNQQVRQFFYIGYLLGIIDGEGCYQFERKYIAHTKNGDYLVKAPKITIYNNNPKIIEQTIKALNFLGIPFWINTLQPHGKGRSVGYILVIVGVKRIKKITDLLLKYSSGKKDRMQLLNDYCNLRLSIPKGKRKDFVKQEQDFFEKLKLLNLQYRKGTVTSETIRFNELS